MDLQGELASLLEEHRVPGAAVAVVGLGGATNVATAGTRGGGRGPVEDRTVFAAASLTKPVFATGVLALVDAGALELDRPLIEYGAQPDLPDDERAASITARMVLSHTTGFPNWREDRPLFLRWAPGTRWGYSGEGYAHLQQVVEHITGTPLDRWLAETVLGPLGMGDSGLGCREDDPNVAVGHDPDGRPQPWSPLRRAKAAAGELYTTAPDYLRFLVHSLTASTRMFEPQIRIDDELAWGLGWGIEDAGGDRAVWQWGNNPGYKNVVLGRPSDGQGVVVLTNGDRGAPVYADVVRRLLPGPHPSLDIRHRPRWLLATGSRPVDLGPRVAEPAVRALLASAGGAGRSPAAGARVLGLVIERSWQVEGVAPGTPIAAIRLEPRGPDEAEITALAVAPEWRRRGLGRALLFGACADLGLGAVEAEATDDAVGFFRANGFVVGRPTPTQRFRCRLEVPQG